MPVTQLGTGKSQFVGHGVSSQSKCSYQWISGPTSSWHRPRLPKRNLKIVSSTPFLYKQKFTKVWNLSQRRGSRLSKVTQLWIARLTKELGSPDPWTAAALSPSISISIAGAQIQQLWTPPSSHWTTSRTQHQRTAVGSLTCGLLKGWTYRIRRQLKPHVTEDYPCAPLWVKDPCLLPLNTSCGARTSHSFGMSAYTLSLTFAS